MAINVRVLLQIFLRMESTQRSGNVRRRGKNLLKRLVSTDLCQQW